MIFIYKNIGQEYALKYKLFLYMLIIFTFSNYTWEVNIIVSTRNAQNDLLWPVCTGWPERYLYLPRKTNFHWRHMLRHTKIQERNQDFPDGRW